MFVSLKQTESEQTVCHQILGHKQTNCLKNLPSFYDKTEGKFIDNRS